MTSVEMEEQTQPVPDQGVQTDQTDSPAFHAMEKWNEPRINVSRTLATFWSFLVMGANDAAYGVSFFSL